ncbi:glycosyltransferase family 2 protein [Acidobacteriota bacterium]
MATKIVYSIVVPVYNEEEVVHESYKQLKEVMDGLHENYELIFINDGSKDKTADILKDFCKKDKRLKLIDFSRNFGHQVAISAGMDSAEGDAVVVIDADLQDPPQVIPQMIDRWKEGYDVVYGKRMKRQGETIFKKLTAAAFYRFLKKMTDVDIPVDVGDFRLIDRSVCAAMKKIKERNRFVRGLISWLGFKQGEVLFERKERYAGTTKYPLRKMIRFALNGVFSFSYKPLKIATFLGILASAAGFFYLIYALYQKFFTDATITGWTSLVSLILIFNGLILFILGIIGEYLGRIYDESKNRPLYVIREQVNFENE